MQTLETLRRTIGSTENLHAVVRTMKVLSLTSIRQCEDAVKSLTDYYRTVRLGLQIALKNRPREGERLQGGAGARMGAIVFGSAWGMCGRFNENLAEYTAAQLDASFGEKGHQLIAIGEYIGGALAMHGLAPDETGVAPEAVEGITARVQDLLVEIDRWRTEQHIGRVTLFYNESTSGAGYSPCHFALLPLDSAWLAQLEREPWPTRVVPTFRMEWTALLASLVRQYLFVSLYRAFAESLASEHSSRLAAMQAAEENVEERLQELGMQFYRLRQQAITEELLEITAGFEALRTEEADSTGA